MKILEPTLVKTASDVATSTGAETEVDFDFAALEGAIILQSQFFTFVDGVVADLEVDNPFSAAFNYNPSAVFASIELTYADDFTFTGYQGHVVAAGTPGNAYTALLTSPLYSHDSILIVRNPSFHTFAGSGSPTHIGKMWYKRVIFDELELVPFVALRR